MRCSQRLRLRCFVRRQPPSSRSRRRPPPYARHEPSSSTTHSASDTVRLRPAVGTQLPCMRARHPLTARSATAVPAMAYRRRRQTRQAARPDGGPGRRVPRRQRLPARPLARPELVALRSPCRRCSRRSAPCSSASSSVPCGGPVHSRTCYRDRHRHLRIARARPRRPHR